MSKTPLEDFKTPHWGLNTPFRETLIYGVKSKLQMVQTKKKLNLEKFTCGSKIFFTQTIETKTVRRSFPFQYHFALKSISDDVLSQNPSPKNFFQKILSLILTNLDLINRNLIKNTRKKFAKKFKDLVVVIKQHQKMTL